ncbi:DUF4149 domain-containing protein [Ideonella paludis]|uniref:DUF4149 domain-containing protein n=1 Tax=Ideonella paludis TaxID=1233411 RepID=A0ABS5DVK2_9BURK|nr:DUF4149 domain-containing protein [Ideonella paludis]MBQ0935145.1 DUF4149 domain-containing protein [Ideonella paludis]
MRLDAWAELLRRLLPGLWAGLLLCVALVATPAPFAVLSSAEAGRVVGHVFAREASVAVFLGAVLLVLERRRAAQTKPEGSQFSVEMGLALLAIFCTVLGYYALQPEMAAAKAGQGRLSFGQLHAISLGLFGIKILAVLALAWRAAQTAER